MLAPTFLLEHAPGKGEDAEPLNFLCPDGSRILAVFDGLGGSGAAKIKTNNGIPLTEARFAAVLARKVVKEFFSALADEYEATEKIARDLQNTLQNRFGEANLKITREPSRLRATVKKQLPTTCCIARIIDSAIGTTLQLFWLGDSRAYCLHPSGVLECITQDHTNHSNGVSALHYYVNNADAPPMTNVISASEGFFVDYFKTDIEPDSLILLCSDGLFGCFKNHLFFEKMFAETLSGIISVEQFFDHINKNRNDDVSFALLNRLRLDSATNLESIKRRLRLLDKATGQGSKSSIPVLAGLGTFSFLKKEVANPEQNTSNKANDSSNQCKIDISEQNEESDTEDQGDYKQKEKEISLHEDNGLHIEIKKNHFFWIKVALFVSILILGINLLREYFMAIY